MNSTRLLISAWCLSTCIGLLPAQALTAAENPEALSTSIVEHPKQISISVHSVALRSQHEEKSAPELAPPPNINNDTKLEESNEALMKRELSLAAKDQLAYHTALDKVQAGAIETAYKILHESINDNAPAHQSRQMLATLLFAHQDFQQAEMLVDQGLLLAPDYASYKKIKARLLLRYGRTEDALQSLLVLPPLLTEDIEYFELLGSLLQLSDAHLQAIDIYKNLLRINIEEAKWWAALGVSHESVGNTAAALSSFQAALLSPELDLGLRQYTEKRVSYLSRHL